MELVRKDLELEKELKQFEDSLEEDKLVNIWIYGRKKVFYFFHSLLFLPFFYFLKLKIILLDIIDLLKTIMWEPPRKTYWF